MRDKATFASVLAVALLAPVAAAADPITAWVASTFAVSATTAAFVVRMAFSLALSALSTALAKKPQQRAGIKTDTTTSGGANPQTFILGKYASAGNMVAPPYSHPNDGAAPNHWLTYVVDVSDIPGVQLSRVMVAGDYVDDLVPVDAGETHQKKGMFTSAGAHFWINWHDGSQTAADAWMLDNYSDHPERPWSEDMVGTGVAYAVLTFVYNRKLFSQLPAVRFEVKGIPLYDPRKDSSFGGSGAQRWADPSTWEYTENPIVMVYNILRGITLTDGTRWGGKAAVEDLPLDSWFAGMNECDMQVPRKNGGTVAQYRAGLEVSLDQEPAEVIDQLLNACSGEIAEVGGTYKVRVGPPGLPVYFLSDEDVVADQPQSLAPYPGLDGVHNAIHASHPSPAALWETRDAPPRYNADWEAEDGGRQLVAQVDLPAVWSNNQAQRLMKAWIDDERRFRRHSLTLPPDAAVLEPLDTLGWTSAREGYTSKVFEVGEITDDLVNCLQTLAIRERDAADFSWDAQADEVEIADPSPVVVLPAPRQVPGFDLLAHILSDGAAAPRRPALRLIWDASVLAEADVLEWRLQLADGTPVASGTVADASEGEVIVSGGVLPATGYRAKMRVLSRHGGEWTDWADAATEDLRLGTGDLSSAAWQAISDDATAAAAALDDQLVLDKIAPLESAVQRDLAIRDVQSFHAAEALGVIGDKVLWAITKLSEIDGRLADAGIYQDPATGTVRIYGVDAEAERISTAEIRLSAAEASITLSATQAWVNQQISNAVLDPSQIPVVGDLQVRVNQVEADLDAAEAAIALRATQTEVDGMEARLSSAEVDIDAAQEAITLKVDQADFDAAESRLSTAEVQISTLDGPAITQTVSDVRTLHDQFGAQDVATLEQLLLAYEQREALKTQIAYATQDIRARVDDDRSATAAITASLGVAIEDSVALIEAEKLVRASGDAALASTIDALEVRLDGDIAAQATATSALTTRVSTAEGAITSHSQSLISLEARLDSAEGGISGQATAQSQLDARVTSAEGVITSHGQSLISLDSRLDDAEGNAAGQATALSQLDTRVSDAEGEVSSQATAITQLQSDVGENSTSIQQTLQTVDGVMGEYTLRIDNNGHVAGMVVRSDLDDEGEPASEIAFQADKFAIVSPDGAQKSSPFVVYTEDRTINGRVYPAATYMENAYLGAASIGRAEIANVIKSDDYVQDGNGIPTAGIKINFDTGRIKAAGVVLSRPMVLAQGAFTITGDVYGGSRWAFVNTGIRVGKSDVWQASNVALVAAAAITSGATAPGGLDPSNTFWTLNAAIQPGARWNGFGGGNADPAASWRKDPAALVNPYWSSGSDQRVFLAIDLETIGGVYFNNPKIEWTVFQVT
ncbi:DUF1983 domain-containing protein [Leisingera sp. F5]|uniref:phage tail tip fiber protein n=1 Tax=Leisingera sp. F5 TaxID=1813816 RepID=UPI000AF79846|nr:DUF1983 domain-containing protein [Leisingera sp. F5]